MDELGCRVIDMPSDFKKAVREFFYKYLPLLSSEANALKNLGIEAQLESFETLVEMGGVKFIKIPNVLNEWQVLLYNLYTSQYEEITFLKEELEALNEN